MYILYTYARIYLCTAGSAANQLTSTVYPNTSRTVLYRRQETVHSSTMSSRIATHTSRKAFPDLASPSLKRSMMLKREQIEWATRGAMSACLSERVSSSVSDATKSARSAKASLSDMITAHRRRFGNGNGHSVKSAPVWQWNWTLGQKWLRGSWAPRWNVPVQPPEMRCFCH